MPVPRPEAVARHPHLAGAPPADAVRIDLHTHTMWSGDSTTTPDEFRDAVAAAGLDVVCITDHNAIDGAERLAGELPCRVVVGEEVRTQQGEIIGLFLTEHIPSGLTPTEAARRIRGQGGVVYVPHPFDPMRANLEERALRDLVEHGLVDAVEVRNAKTSLEHLNRRATHFADENGLLPGAGSDAHVPEALGAAYVQMPDFDDRDPDAFLTSLAAGAVVGHHFDPPRVWRPRIVPSTAGE